MLGRDLSGFSPFIQIRGNKFLLQGQVIVKLENYESAHKITYTYEKKTGVQVSNQKCPTTSFVFWFRLQREEKDLRN